MNCQKMGSKLHFRVENISVFRMKCIKGWNSIRLLLK